LTFWLLLSLVVKDAEKFALLSLVLPKGLDGGAPLHVRMSPSADGEPGAVLLAQVAVADKLEGSD
jgi:hypothetical protein